MIQYMQNGKGIDLTGDPYEEVKKIDIETIAHHLSNMYRFKGWVRYSVASHSVHVSLLTVNPLAGLLHDAHECITGDIGPVGRVVPGWLEFETLWSQAIFLRFFCAPCDSVKLADKIALNTERAFLLGPKASAQDWGLVDVPICTKFDPRKETAKGSKQRFLDRYRELTN